MKKKNGVKIHVIKARESIEKAEAPTNITKESASSVEWITPTNDMQGLRQMVKHSDILPQCINAYKNNIAGFGLDIKYKEDAKETDDMGGEYTRAKEILTLLNMDMDIKELFEHVVEARETYGIAYTEVIRSIAGEVAGLEFIKDTPSIRKTVPLEPFVQVEYYLADNMFTRLRKFCKYKQEIAGKTVYFKEFGDPRIMDNRTGKYIEGGGTLDLSYQANEIMEFALGTEAYGEVRWIGQVLGIDGSRKAESLNNRYFKEPNITNPDDIMRIINVTERAGGLTPNKAKEITLSMLGETSENYDGDWGDTPLVLTRTQAQGAIQPQNLAKQLDMQISKAGTGDNDAVIAIMKEVKAVLESMCA